MKPVDGKQTVQNSKPCHIKNIELINEAEMGNTTSEVIKLGLWKE